MYARVIPPYILKLIGCPPWLRILGRVNGVFIFINHSLKYLAKTEKKVGTFYATAECGIKDIYPSIRLVEVIGNCTVGKAHGTTQRNTAQRRHWEQQELVAKLHKRIFSVLSNVQSQFYLAGELSIDVTRSSSTGA